MDNGEQRRLRGEMTNVDFGREGGGAMPAVTWTRVAFTADVSADGYLSDYTWNARNPMGGFLLHASTSRVWYGSRLK